MRCCCFTYGKKRLYAAAVFFEDEDEDVGFLSSFERDRERENNNNNTNYYKTRYRYHQYHAFVKVYIIRVLPFPVGVSKLKLFRVSARLLHFVSRISSHCARIYTTPSAVTATL